MSKQVLFDASEKQTQFLEAIFSGDYRVVLFGGAIRGGKTFAGLGALILLCRFYPGSRWAVVRDTLQTLKRNTLPAWEKIKPTNFVKSYNKDTQTVTMNNGSQIMWFSENFDQDKELNRWKGLEVNGFLLEECNELQLASFNKAVERAGSYILTKGKQPKPIIIMTCNPTTGWVKDMFYTPWKEGRLKQNWTYIPSKITDNPYVSQDYIDSLQDLPRYEYEVFVEGNWDVNLKTGGEFYKKFELDKHVGRARYNEELPLHITFDFNVNPYMTLIVCQIEGKELRLIDELCMEDPFNTTPETCREFARRYRMHEAGVFIYGDATGKKRETVNVQGENQFKVIENELIRYHPNFRVPAANPPIAMRGSFINAILGEGFEGIGFMVDENCKKSISDFIDTKEASDGTKNKEMTSHPRTKVRYQKYGHITDAMDYLIVEAFKTEYQIFTTGSRGTIARAGSYRRTSKARG